MALVKPSGGCGHRDGRSETSRATCRAESSSNCKVTRDEVVVVVGETCAVCRAGPSASESAGPASERGRRRSISVPDNSHLYTCNEFYPVEGQPLAAPQKSPLSPFSSSVRAPLLHVNADFFDFFELLITSTCFPHLIELNMIFNTGLFYTCTRATSFTLFGEGSLGVVILHYYVLRNSSR